MCLSYPLGKSGRCSYGKIDGKPLRKAKPHQLSSYVLKGSHELFFREAAYNNQVYFLHQRLCETLIALMVPSLTLGPCNAIGAVAPGAEALDFWQPWEPASILAACAILTSRYTGLQNIVWEIDSAPEQTVVLSNIKPQQDTTIALDVNPELTIEELKQNFNHFPTQLRCSHFGPANAPSPLSAIPSSSHSTPVVFNFVETDECVTVSTIARCGIHVIFQRDPATGGTRLKTLVDEEVVDPLQARRLEFQAAEVLVQLSKLGSSARISRVGSITTYDKYDLFSWNATTTAYSHNIPSICSKILRQASLTPDGLAIRAWDAEMTYSQLVRDASALGRKLSDMGVLEDTFVPFSFEKSAYALVAMLGTLLSGAAFVPLEPSFPIARMQSIVEQLEAKIILTSRELYAETCKIRSSYDCLVVDRKSLDDLHTSNESTASRYFTNGHLPNGYTSSDDTSETSYSPSLSSENRSHEDTKVSAATFPER